MSSVHLTRVGNGTFDFYGYSNELCVQIDADEKDELQKEAEEMNELGIRKLPRDDDGPDPEKVSPQKIKFSAFLADN